MGISVGKLRSFMPRSLQYGRRQIGLGNRIEIQLAQTAKIGCYAGRQLGLLMSSAPLFWENKIERLENRILNLQEDQQIVRLHGRFFEDAPIGFHILDDKGKILDINNQWLESLGYTKSEVIGKSIFDFIVPEQRGNARRRFFLRIIGTSEDKLPPKTDDRLYLKKDGTAIKAYTVNSVFVQGGKKTVLTSFLDVTRLRELEDQLNTAREAIVAQERFAAIANMAAQMSHALKNFLAGSLGSTDLLKNACVELRALLEIEKLTGDKQVEFSSLTATAKVIEQLIENLNRNLELMSSTTRRMLDFSRSASAQVVSIAVKKEMADLIGQMENSALRQGVQIIFENNLDDSDGVLMDKLEFHDLLTNLIANAVESYQGSKREEKTIKINGFKNRENKIVFLVIDHGCGMSTERRAEILNESNIVVQSFKPKSYGLGFGAVKSILRRYGGRMDINSKLDRGTSIAVFLDRKEYDPSQEAAEVEATHSQRILQELAEIKIMLVDDEEGNGQLYLQILKNMGFKACFYSDPNEALLAYKSAFQKPQIVLTDMRMPQMTGAELIRMIAEGEQRQDLPRFVVFSGNVKLSEPEGELKALIDDFGVRTFQKAESLRSFKDRVYCLACEILGIDPAKKEEEAGEDVFTGFALHVGNRISSIISFLDYFDLRGLDSPFKEEILLGHARFLDVVEEMNNFAQAAGDFEEMEAEEFLRKINPFVAPVFDIYEKLNRKERYKLALIVAFFLKNGLNDFAQWVKTGIESLDVDELREKAGQVQNLCGAMPLRQQEALNLLLQYFRQAR